MENSDKIFLYDEEKHQYNLSDTDFKGEVVAQHTFNPSAIVFGILRQKLPAVIPRT